MRHGPAPRNADKSTTFPPGRDNGGGIHTDSMPKQPNRDHVKDAYSYVPGMSRSYTTKTTPKKAGFAPGTPGGDEPPARNASAYFNVHRGATSRESAPVPPTTRQPPSAKKADPLYPFRNHGGGNETYVNAARVSTPYATAGGEKTYFSSRPLGRSSSWREGKTPSDYYESDPMGTKSPHLRPSSGAPDRNRSSSPRMRSRSERRAPSPSTSSSSSSDESVEITTPEKFYGSVRPPTNGQRANGRGRTEGRAKPNLQPSVETEDAEDEDSARSGRSHLGQRLGTRPQKQQPERRQFHDAGENHSEGFTPHRMQPDATTDDTNFPPSSASKAYTPATSTIPTVPPRPLNKPRSWHNDRKPAQGIPPDENLGQPDMGRQEGNPRMYESSSSSSSSSSSAPPSSVKWSDQWPFMSPKKPRHPAAAPPPPWAIPSSLFPKRQRAEEAQIEIENFFPSEKTARLSKSNNANSGLPCSFTFSHKDPGRASQNTPSLKSRSTETINVKFSPDWPSTFTGGTNEYFFSSSTQHYGDAGRRTSPVRVSPSRVYAVPHKRPSSPCADASNGPEPPEKKNTEVHPPPATEEWAQHFKPAVWNYPPPPRSPAQKTMRKRQPASRRTWKTSSTSQFPIPSPRKPYAATVDDCDAEGEENEASSAAESASSRISGDESPMDIDQALTPPSAPQSQLNGGGSSPSGPAPAEAIPRPTAPAVPPRPKSSHAQNPHLNLEGLKNVAPLAPSDDGLRNLGDLNTTLPFESRPSNQPVHELSSSSSSAPPPPLLLPHPPKAPPVPENLTQTTWERYQAHMGSYMFEWNLFNRKMLDHFVGRQASVADVLKPNWMSAVGNGTERWGYKKYMQDLEEDFRVREHWDVSWEKHRECMRGLGSVRERLLGSRIQTQTDFVNV